MSTLVGSANEASVSLQGIHTTALLDTGSSVSTVSQSFYETHLSDIPLQPVTSLLALECADGSELPYLGFIACPLQVDGISDSRDGVDCLFLVVKTTDYHASVPVLLGTNILSLFLSQTKERLGVRYLQKGNLCTPWLLAFKCLSMREKELERSQNVLAIVKSAERGNVTIPPQ